MTTTTTPSDSSTPRPPRSRVRVDLTALAANTGLAIEQLTPAKTARRVYANEPGLPGLHVVVAPSGSVAWAFNYVNAKGQRRSAKLAEKRAANAMLMDRATAVALAHKMREKALAGQDVLEDRAEQAEKHALDLARIKASRKLVIDVIDQYARHLEETGGASAPGVFGLIAEPTPATLTRCGNVSRTTLKPILAVAAMPVTKFGKDEAQAVLTAYEARGVKWAGRVLTTCRAAWNFVANHKVHSKTFGLTREMNPWRNLRVEPPKGVTVKKRRGDSKVKATTVLEPEEFARLVLRWEQPAGTITNARGRVVPVPMDKRQALACQLIVFTGQRTRQCLSVRVQDVDLQKRLWTIPFERRKVARKIIMSGDNEKIQPHIVALNDAAVGVLRALLALHHGEGGGAQYGFDYLIPRFDQKGRMYNEPRETQAFNRWVQSWAKRVGITVFTPRDARRCWKTWASKWRIPFETRNRVQDHALRGLDENYNFDDFMDQQHEAAQVFDSRWRAVLAEAKETQGNVHHLALAGKAA